MEFFLDAEASHKELADEILHFCNSFEIRRGEFECNCHVIEKIDSDNFIIYQDFTDQNGNRSIMGAFSIYRKDLQEKLIKNAKKCGYSLNPDYIID